MSEGKEEDNDGVWFWTNVLQHAIECRPLRDWDQKQVNRLERILKRASDGVLKFMTMTQESGFRRAQDKLEFFLLLPKGSLKIGNEDHQILILRSMVHRELGLASLECLGSELHPPPSEHLHDYWLYLEKTMQSEMGRIFRWYEENGRRIGDD